MNDIITTTAAKMSEVGSFLSDVTVITIGLNIHPRNIHPKHTSRKIQRFFSSFNAFLHAEGI